MSTTWYPSILDATGRNVSGGFDGSAFYAGVDVGGVARFAISGAQPSGTWSAGLGIVGSNFNPVNRHVAGVTCDIDSSKIIAVSGLGGSGGIWRRLTGGIWTLSAAAYFGSGGSGGFVNFGGSHPRNTGRRVAVKGTTVWVSCQSSASRFGIARSTNNGAAFSDFDFSLGNWCGLSVSPNFTAAGNIVLYGSCVQYLTSTTQTAEGTNRGVYLFQKADGTSVRIRLDTQGTGAHSGGLYDARDVVAVSENGKDVLYVAVGGHIPRSDLSDRGIWRCVLGLDGTGKNPSQTGYDPTTGCTWNQIKSGSQWYCAVTARRNPADTATYVMVGDFLTAPTGDGSVYKTWNSATQDWTKSSNFSATHWRTLNGHAASPTWDNICNLGNMTNDGTLVHSPAVYGKPGEYWDAMARSTAPNHGDSRVGGSSFSTGMMSVYAHASDASQDLVCVNGKGGSWICVNPWGSGAGTPKWQALVNGTGGIAGHEMMVDPTNNKHVVLGDTDRNYWRWTNTDDQPDKCYADQMTTVEGIWIQGSDHLSRTVAVVGAGSQCLIALNPWANPGASAAQHNQYSSAGTPGGTVYGLCRFTSSGSDILLALTSTGIHRSTNDGSSWATTNMTTGTIMWNSLYFSARNNTSTVYCFEPGSGLWRSSNAGSNWTKIWAKTAVNNEGQYGSMAQDRDDEHTLYLTFGDGGLWKVTSADGTPITTHLLSSRDVGPVGCDPITGDVVVAVTGMDSTGADCLLSSNHGSSWTSIGDATYANCGTAPQIIQKVDDRIYVMESTQGTFMGIVGGATPTPPTITSANSTTFTYGVISSFAVNASNSPTSYGESGALPAGITFNTSTGVLSGTTTATGTYSITFSATNGAGTGTQSFTLTVSAAPPSAPVITSANTKTFANGVAGTFAVTATNSPTSFSASGTLPVGVSFNTSTGVLSGTSTATGSYALTLSAANASGTGTQSFTLTISAPTGSAPVITSTNNTTFSNGFSGTFTVTATNSPTSFSVSGSLPSGITFNTTSGILSGTPTTSGNFPLIFSATNSIGTGTQSFTLTVFGGTSTCISSAWTTHSARPGPDEGGRFTGHVDHTAGVIIGSNFYVMPCDETTNTTSLWRYTPSTETWTQLALMPGSYGKIFAMSTTAWSGNLFSFGGISTGNSLATIAYRYNVSSNTWTALTAVPGGGRYWHNSMTVGNKTYLIGGYDNSDTVKTTIDVYDHLTGTWTSGTVAALPFHRALMGGTVANGKIYLAGGATFSGSTTVYSRLDCYDPVTNTWTLLSPMAAARVRAPMVSDGTKLLISGGGGSDYITSIASTESYDIASNVWTASVPLSPARSGHAAGQMGNVWWINGGNLSGRTECLLPSSCQMWDADCVGGVWTSNCIGDIGSTDDWMWGSIDEGGNVITPINPPVITSASSTTFAAGSASSFTVTATNNPTSFGIGGTLPTGITFNTSTGVLSGTVTSGAGTYNLTVSASNAGGTGTQSFTLTTTGGSAPSITSANSTSFAYGSAGSFTVTATNSPTSFAVSGTLPAGITFNTSTGVLSGTSTAVGATYPLTFSATNASGTGTQSFTLLTTGTPAPTITSAASASFPVGTSSTFTVTATNSPTSFGRTGTLPGGITFNTSTGVLSGTATGSAASWPLTFSATNASGTGTQSFTLTTTGGTIPSITSATSTSFAYGSAGSFTVTATNSPTSFAVSGTLPAGITFNTSTGVLSGTSSAAGSIYNLTFSATNASGTGTQSFTLTTTGGPASSTKIFIGAGDISEVGGTDSERTVPMLTTQVNADPTTTVFAAGDCAYTSGTTQEFNTYYDPTWGIHKARTKPSPGNHEYLTANASGYFTYFNSVLSPYGADATNPSRGFYMVPLGNWRILSVNTELSATGLVTQGNWITAMITANPGKHFGAICHRPRYSSGSHHGSNEGGKVTDIWNALFDGAAEWLISGHEHNYERFNMMNKAGAVDTVTGVRQWVVGTGGANFYALTTGITGSQVRNDNTLGVLKMTLDDASYSWEFMPEAGGTFTDSGTQATKGGGSSTCISGGGSYQPTDYALAHIQGYIFGDDAGDLSMQKYNTSNSQSTARFMACANAIGANTTDNGGSITVNSPDLGSDNTSLPANISTGTADEVCFKKRAFLMSLIEGEGSFGGLVLDDPDAAHRQVGIDLLTYFGLGNENRGLNQKVYCVPSDSGGLFQNWPFANRSRVPGG